MHNWVSFSLMILLALATTACNKRLPSPSSYPEARIGAIADPWGVSQVPQSANLTPQDQLYSLHAMALAVSERQVKESYIWSNRVSGNSGGVRVVGMIKRGDYRGCLGLEFVVTVKGKTYREYPAACRNNLNRGNGGSNTFIINKKWVLSSVVKRHNGKCQTRFMDTRLSRGRVQSTETVCQDENVWEIGG